MQQLADQGNPLAIEAMANCPDKRPQLPRSVRQKQILALISETPKTILQISKELGISGTSTLAIVTGMHKNGKVHVPYYIKTAQAFIAGGGVDAEKPKAKPTIKLVKPLAIHQRRPAGVFDALF